MKKIRVGILFGGKSAEHEVSLQSAKNIIEAIDKSRYEVVLIGIDKQGAWHATDESQYLLNASNPKLIKLNKSSASELAVVPGKQHTPLMAVTSHGQVGPVDVIFPVLHGPFGEDGTVQGMLKLAGIPFVGASVLGSAVGMDKDVMKRLLRDAGIPTAKFITVARQRRSSVTFEYLREHLGLPFFVKPAGLGSSVGISKIKTRADFASASDKAFAFDHKVLYEEAIVGREIEVSVLGNESPIASVPGEIIPKHEFYSYDAKYIDETGARLEVPARLEAGVVAEAQQLAIRVFQALECEGMARVDFFLTREGQLVVNELNSIPGFTRISMYPRLWEATGIPYSDLIHRLITLALERHERDKALKISYEP